MTKKKIKDYGKLVDLADKMAMAARPWSDAATGKRNLLNLTMFEIADLHLAMQAYMTERKGTRAKPADETQS